VTIATIDKRSLGEELDLLIQGDQQLLADPYPLWGRLREEAPVYEHRLMTFISRYRDVQTMLLANDRLSRSSFNEGAQALAFRASLSGAAGDAFDAIADFESGWLVRSSGEQHKRLRRTVHRAFTPRRISELRATIELTANDLLTDLAASEPADFVQSFGDRLPMMSIAHMFAAPPEDATMLYRWVEPLKMHIATRREKATEADAALVVEARAGMDELREYVKDLARTHAKQGASMNLVGLLLDAREEERLDEDGLAALMVNLLFAGRDTTRGLLVNGLVALLGSRQEWTRLCDDPNLAGSAVEELMRFVSPAQGIPAVVTEDIEITDQSIPAGSSVYLVAAAANRDPEIFRDPERLDIAREDSRLHVGFGLGPHFCLGSSLARLEGQIAFSTLARRFPDLELEPTPIVWQGPFKLRHPAALPVSLGRERAAA
jgi:cytochrome P450